MALSKLKVYCQGFQWNPSAIGGQFYKVSFLNKQNLPTAFTERVDITPYILTNSLGELQYVIEEVELSESGFASHYFRWAEFPFAVSGGKNSKFMRSFFRIDEYDTRYNKYKLEIYYDGVRIFEGTIGQGDIYMEESLSNTNHRIDLTAWGKEKEVKDYYSGIRLGDFNTIGGIYQSIYSTVFFTENNNQPQHLDLVTFKGLVERMFENNFNVEIAPDIKTWLVFNRAHFFKAQGNAGRLIWYKSGYYFAQLDGTSKWALFVYLLNSLGLVFSFYVKAGVLTMGIRNRYSTSLSVFNITSKFLSNPPIGHSHTDPSPLFKHVVIRDGDMIGGDTSLLDYKLWRGAKCVVVSNTSKQVLNANHFVDVDSTPTTYNQYNFIQFGQIISENEDSFTYGVMNLSTLGLDNYTINKSETLIIDCGYSNYGMQISRTNKMNFMGQDLTNLTDDNMFYKGNYGGMLGYTGNGSPYWLDVFNWFDYVNSDPQFLLNMKVFIESGLNVTKEFSIPEVVVNPMQAVNVPSGYPIQQGLWNLSSFRVNFETGTTTFNVNK